MTGITRARGHQAWIPRVTHPRVTQPTAGFGKLQARGHECSFGARRVSDNLRVTNLR